MAHPNQAIGDLEGSEKFMSSICGGLAVMVSASKPKSLEEALIVAIEAETHTNRDKRQEPVYNRRYARTSILSPVMEEEAPGARNESPPQD